MKQHRKLFVVIVVCVFLILLAIGVVFFVYRCLRSPASILSPQIDAAIKMQSDPSILYTFPQYPFSREGNVTFGDMYGICIERFIDGKTV